jgi:hypothetical protein
MKIPEKQHSERERETEEEIGGEREKEYKNK